MWRPNPKSFGDHLNRVLFGGAGHLQRFGSGDILRTVYASTGLKLVAFAEWLAGFTYLGDYDGLRRFVFAIVGEIYRAPNVDLLLRSNFLMVFRKGRALGYRLVPRVCFYCGGSNVELSPEESAGPRWQCRICGRPTEARGVTVEEVKDLDAQVRALRGGRRYLAGLPGGAWRLLRRWLRHRVPQRRG